MTTIDKPFRRGPTRAPTAADLYLWGQYIDLKLAEISAGLSPVGYVTKADLDAALAGGSPPADGSIVRVTNDPSHDADTNVVNGEYTIASGAPNGPFPNPFEDLVNAKFLTLDGRIVTVEGQTPLTPPDLATLQADKAHKAGRLAVVTVGGAIKLYIKAGVSGAGDWDVFNPLAAEISAAGTAATTAAITTLRGGVNTDADDLSKMRAKIVTDAGAARAGAVSDIRGGVVTDFDTLEKLRAGLIAARTNELLNYARLSGGKVDPAILPDALFAAPIVSAGLIADLSAGQQSEIVGGSTVLDTGGQFWAYTGTGSKTLEASYLPLADRTPAWSAIAGKPTTRDGFGLTDVALKTESDQKAVDEGQRGRGEAVSDIRAGVNADADDLSKVRAKIETDAGAARTGAVSDIRGGVVTDFDTLEKLRAGLIAARTNELLNYARLSGGKVDPAILPDALFAAPIVAAGLIADLTAPQQAQIAGGSTVLDTSGQFWAYTGTGDKTLEASYLPLADRTPAWSAIADKPTTRDGAGFVDIPTVTEMDAKAEAEGAAAQTRAAQLVGAKARPVTDYSKSAPAGAAMIESGGGLVVIDERQSAGGLIAGAVDMGDGTYTPPSDTVTRPRGIFGRVPTVANDDGAEIEYLLDGERVSLAAPSRPRAVFSTRGGRSVLSAVMPYVDDRGAPVIFPIQLGSPDAPAAAGDIVPLGRDRYLVRGFEGHNIVVHIPPAWGQSTAERNKIRVLWNLGQSPNTNRVGSTNADPAKSNIWKFNPYYAGEILPRANMLTRGISGPGDNTQGTDDVAEDVAGDRLAPLRDASVGNAVTINTGTTFESSHFVRASSPEVAATFIHAQDLSEGESTLTVELGIGGRALKEFMHPDDGGTTTYYQSTLQAVAGRVETLLTDLGYEVEANVVEVFQTTGNHILGDSKDFYKTDVTAFYTRLKNDFAGLFGASVPFKMIWMISAHVYQVGGQIPTGYVEGQLSACVDGLIELGLSDDAALRHFHVCFPTGMTGEFSELNHYTARGYMRLKSSLAHAGVMALRADRAEQPYKWKPPHVLETQAELLPGDTQIRVPCALIGEAGALTVKGVADPARVYIPEKTDFGLVLAQNSAGTPPAVSSVVVDSDCPDYFVVTLAGAWAATGRVISGGKFAPGTLSRQLQQGHHIASNAPNDAAGFEHDTIGHNFYQADPEFYEPGNLSPLPPYLLPFKIALAD